MKHSLYLVLIQVVCIFENKNYNVGWLVQLFEFIQAVVVGVKLISFVGVYCWLQSRVFAHFESSMATDKNQKIGIYSTTN